MRQKFTYLYVFLTGAVVMSVEMSASRLIAPYFGSSLMVWANIIGIILLAMSGGYMFGGRLADRHPYPRLLFSLTLSAGLILTIIPFIAQMIFRLLTKGILATPAQVTFFAFIGVLIVFAPPVFLLAMVSPYVLRLAAPTATETGKIAGRLYAFSTLGSLGGTFLTSLVLIPQIGTRATVFISAFVLLAVSAWGLKHWWAFLIALLPLFPFFFMPHTIKAAGDVLWEKETPYQYVQVVRQPDQSIALVYNEGGGVQSIVRPNGLLLPQDYYNYYLVLPFLRPQEKPAVWILGSAGGTMFGLFDRWVRPSFSNLRLTGVEIDPDVIPLGQKFFGLSGKEGSVFNTDARTFLTNNPDKADLIIIDAYSQQIYIPFHLSTQEFYQEVAKHLNPNGILALNVNATSSSSSILESFEKTLGTVFKYTYLLPVPESYNFVLLASDQPLPDRQMAVKTPPELKPFFEAYQKYLNPAHPLTGLIFTDDHAPVEFMTDQMIWQEIWQNKASPTQSSNFPNPVLDLPQEPENQDPIQNVQLTVPGSLLKTGNDLTDKPLIKSESYKLYEEGHSEYDQRRFPQAIKLFDKALEFDANCYPALTLKGATLAFQGQYDEGLALIRQALNIEPSYVYAYFNMGLANELAGRWDPAIAAYKQAIKMDERNTWSYYGIASIYGRQGDIDHVLEYLQPAIRLNPDVKGVAHTEQDFAPVRNNLRFQELVNDN